MEFEKSKKLFAKLIFDSLNEQLKILIKFIVIK